MFDVTHKTRRTLLRGAAALTLVAGLALTAACGSDDGGETATESRTGDNGEVYNTADLQFANQMIPHHAQAVQMANMTMDRPIDAPVRRLADDIRAAQTPEVQQMVEWLTGWGEEIPETPIDHSNAGHGGEHLEGGGMEGMEEYEDMPGMMSAEDMKALADASDGEFQDLWLEMMIEHHEGAVEMAQEQQEQGSYKDAVQLARGIESGQQKEISTMEGLLG
jgi:uncharacterized protein (DUF305 family)